MSIVIVAGYEKPMKENFMKTNEGLPRRFPYRYVLREYSANELCDILINTLVKKLPNDIKIGPTISNFLFSTVSRLLTENPRVFENQAGDMLNLAASITKTINSSYTLKWNNKKPSENIPIILNGIDDFLQTKS
jgi:hypothetical protein